MKLIGVTGGVGAGKSAILSYIQEHYGARILQADRIAEEIMQPGTVCDQRLKEVFARDGVFRSDGSLDRGAMAAVIFRDPAKRKQVNDIVHPLVKEYVIGEVEKERQQGRFSYVVLEAALLLEEGYDKICDELWYIYADESVRAARLKEKRGYSEEKIQGIFSSQLPEETFRRCCECVIDNNTTKEAAYAQIDRLLGAKEADH